MLKKDKEKLKATFDKLKREIYHLPLTDLGKGWIIEIEELLAAL